MPTLGKLIEGLESEGVLDSRGRFTLDPKKAREKMRQFQLAEPRRYVLLLVEAAHLKGATTLRFELDADDTRLQFDGAPFGPEELKDLFTSLFARTETDENRALRKLALGMNAALALQPRFATIVTGDGRTTHRATLGPNKPELVEQIPDQYKGTRIHVKEAIGTDVLFKFFRQYQGELVEARALFDHCSYATTDILVNGEPVASGLKLPHDAQGVLTIHGDGIRGVAGHLPSDAKSTATVLSNGVKGMELTYTTGTGCFRAVAESSRLKKDVSQQSFVEDDAFQDLLKAIASAREASMVEVARLAAGTEGTAAVLAWATAFTKQALMSRVTHSASVDSGSDVFVRLASQIPLWKTAVGESRDVTLAELVKQVRTKGALPMSPRPYPHETFRNGAPVLLVESVQDRKFFEKLFAKKLRDIRPAMRRQQAQTTQRTRWRARKAKPELTGNYWASHRFRVGSIRGEVGVPASQDFRRTRATASLVVDGHLLCELTPEPPFPTIHARVAANLKPTVSYTDVHKNNELAKTVLALVEALDPLIAQLAHTRSQLREPETTRADGIAKEYLRLVLARNFPANALQAFGFSESSSKRFAKRYWKADRAALLATDGTDTPGRHPLASWPLFDMIRRGGGGRLSLHDLQIILRTDASVAYLPRHAPGKGISSQVLRLDPYDLGILELAFGKSRFRELEASPAPPPRAKPKKLVERVPEARPARPVEPSVPEAVAKPAPRSEKKISVQKKDLPAPPPKPATPKPTRKAAVVPEPSPEERLISALREKLHALRHRERRLLDNVDLTRMRVSPVRRGVAVECDQDATTLNAQHPLVATALENWSQDPILLSFLASSTYSALNIWLESVKDQHERDFHQYLAAELVPDEPSENS